MPLNRSLCNIQVDVEGSELRVLSGMSSVHWRLVKAISIEAHNVGSRVRDILRLLVAPLTLESTVDAAAAIGGGFIPEQVIVHQPAFAETTGMNNLHIFAWR
jgi:hypothetical protein